MTEKDFLKVFNDIDDKYIDEDSGKNASVKPVIVTEKDVKRKRSTWNTFIPAAACIAAAGGLIAASIFFSGRDSGNHIILDGFAGNGNNNGDILFWDGSDDNNGYYSSVANSNPSFVHSNPFSTVNPSLNSEITIDPSYELPLLDGTHIFSNSPLIISSYNSDNQYYGYTIDGCYVVPFFTPSERRTAGEKGDWIFITQGSEINGLKVESASSSYEKTANSDYFFPLNYQATVEFSGEFECTAKAELCENEYGDVKALLTLERESCEKFLSLCPSIKDCKEESYNPYKFDFEKEKVQFNLFNKLQGYDDVYNALSEKDSVRVKVKFRDFSLIYFFEPGSYFRGVTELVGFDYDLEILE